jgi:hypothetical protein
MKTGPDALGTAKTRPDAQNLKSGPDALRTAENVSGSENLKTGPDAVGTAENEFGREKHENGCRHPRFRRKRIWERKTSKWDPTPSPLPKMSPGT